MKKWGIIVLVAALLAALVCQFKGDAWEETVRNAMYAMRGDSIPNFAADVLDEQGVPFVIYATENGITPGKQYNPTIVANYALDYELRMQQGDTLAGQRFMTCANWLADHMYYAGDKALYRFEWRQAWYDSVKAPYTSGMTSGRAMEVFAKAWQYTHDTAWLQRGMDLRRGFFIPVSEGGFAFFEPQGWWYEEIADTGMHTPRILDGHMFALMGVQKFSVVAGDDSSKVIIEKGLQALQNALPSYDAGNGKFYYDKYQKLADKKYRRIITSQLLELYQLTGNPFYKAYYDKWTAPMRKPYVYRMVKDGNRSGIILFMLLTLSFSILLLSFRLVLRKSRKEQASA